MKTQQRRSKRSELRFLCIAILLAFGTLQSSAQSLHQVSPGESLSEIAQQKVGGPVFVPKKGSLWQVLELNPDIGDPNLIYPGQSIRLPVDTTLSYPTSEPPIAEWEHEEGVIERAEPIEEAALAVDFRAEALGPFYYKKTWGLWSQLGPSFVKQNLSNPEGKVSNSQAALRAGVGTWWRVFHLEGYWRQGLKSRDVAYAPRWLQGLAGYAFEGPDLSFIVPHIFIFGGVEKYNNTTAQNQSTFIRRYTAPLLGFRTRFIFSDRFETGGDFYSLFVSNGRKFFIQGDIRYWMTGSFALGGGYWIDLTKISEPGVEFKENSYALELYLSYTF